MKLYKKQKMTVDYKENAYKIGDVSVSTMEMKTEMPLKDLGPLASVVLITTLFSKPTVVWGRSKP